MALEAERQRRYNDSIRDKQTVISSLISMGTLTPGVAVLVPQGGFFFETGPPPGERTVIQASGWTRNNYSVRFVFRPILLNAYVYHTLAADYRNFTGSFFIMSEPDTSFS